MSYLLFRHATTRPLGSVQRQQTMDSSAEARWSMSPMVWLRLSTPPPMLLDHPFLLVLQAAHKLEVKNIFHRYFDVIP